MVDDLGTGKYQDKIIEAIRRCSRKIPGKSVTELQMEIFELRKDIRTRHERLEILKSELEKQTSPEKYEDIQKNINEDIEIWWKAIS